ncbi:aconitate hydratase 1 [Candidatus Xenohaliotis californiensis]|uniref:Aconitate hydratase n=1 Tax=Candidatus Xenohaliotis californiensis TaxID=84677 RepID=A0ABM9N7U8_9RICK|nr:aconitate hydratase 1 [Candidatus Xenohaliotis californiensis]
MPFNKKEFIDSIKIAKKKYSYFSIDKISQHLNIQQQTLPKSLKILLENSIRGSESLNIKKLKTLKNWPNLNNNLEINFMPSRILMQDFTGVPALVDLASMRNAAKNANIALNNINPLIPVDLIIDHSVQVDYFGSKNAFKQNIKEEYRRNKERYKFLHWAQKSFSNLNIFPPGIGICHQINLEFLANVVMVHKNGTDNMLYPDTLLGTDSHTTMINALGVLGWGVGGIEAEASMLGKPLVMPIPQIVGVKLVGKKPAEATATDVVLLITNILRKKNVVSKFVEFYGKGVDNLSLADRATISNMSPEYGATCGFFAVDDQTIEYLTLTGRPRNLIEIIQQYWKLQGLYGQYKEEPQFSEIIEIDISNSKISYAGPKRPQDLLTISSTKIHCDKKTNSNIQKNAQNKNYQLKNGDVVIAAITSCTNTSNPYVMIGAGMIAKNIVKYGLKTKPWVKTSLAPGSRVVSEYLDKLGLTEYLENLGFNLVGYGCTTCIGNSGALNEDVTKQIIDKDLDVAAVLSGNRNFEGRINQLTKSNYLMSPIMVVVHAVVGNMCTNLLKEPIGFSKNNKPVYLKDVLPKQLEINLAVKNTINGSMFTENYKNSLRDSPEWLALDSKAEMTYQWDEDDLYIQNPPYFDNMKQDRNLDIVNAHILAIFGDGITTDHISPAGTIAKDSAAAKFLKKNKVKSKDFNSYGSRRGNHHIMMRGTFSNIRIKNLMVKETEGGITRHIPSNKVMNIFDAAMLYKNKNDLVVIAGKDYGMGSSRDWAAKGTSLLGVKVVIAESFERIHLSNLIGVGIIPLIFIESNAASLKLSGYELISFPKLNSQLKPNGKVECIIQYPDQNKTKLYMKCAAKTTIDTSYIRHNGILPWAMMQIIESKK